jgi:hypothetical protein
MEPVTTNPKAEKPSMKSTEKDDAQEQLLKLHNGRIDHLKVACLPIPPYAPPVRIINQATAVSAS